MKGKNNPNYKHGKTHNNKCIVCEAKISYAAIKCEKCYQKTLKGKLNPNFGNHILSKKYLGKNNPFFGKKHTKESLKKISEYSKKIWSSIENKEKMILAQRKGMSLRPNNIESYLIKLFNKYRMSFKYIGDKQYLLEGFNPDFIDIKNKQIIEFNGTYWHNLKNRKKSDKRKLKVYKKLGYSYLILTEKDLINENKLINKIIKFKKGV